MKSILISIKPKWVAKILNGEKTIEIRKTAPKCDLPVDVYIYCTKDKRHLLRRFPGFRLKQKGMRYQIRNRLYFSNPPILNGKIVAKFTLRKIERVVSCVAKDWGDDPWEMRYSIRLEESDAPNLDDQLMYKGGFESEWTNPVYDYLGFDFPTCHPGFGKRPDFKEGVVYGYAWHISDLEIFDEPKDLSELGLMKAPQSWCYVEENE